MRARIVLFLLLVARTGHAIEVDGEVEAGGDFLYAQSTARAELADGRVAIGGGTEVVSDYKTARAGGEAVVDAVGEWLAGGLGVGYAPRRQGRGWLWLEPHGTLRREREHWSIEGELGAKLRRADAGVARSTISIDQIQLRAEGRFSAGAWSVGLRALYSFYDPDPARLGRGFDGGLLITVADRPERWAVLVDGARQLRGVRLGAGLGAVGYADGRGTVLVPRAAVKLGPFRGVSPGISVDVVLATVGPPEPRPFGGLTLEYER